MAIQPALLAVQPGMLFTIEVILLLIAAIFWLWEQRRMEAGNAPDYFVPTTFVCLATVLLGVIHLTQPILGVALLFWAAVTAGAGYIWGVLVWPIFGPSFFALDE